MDSLEKKYPFDKKLQNAQIELACSIGFTPVEKGEMAAGVQCRPGAINSTGVGHGVAAQAYPGIPIGPGNQPLPKRILPLGPTPAMAHAIKPEPVNTDDGGSIAQGTSAYHQAPLLNGTGARHNGTQLATMRPNQNPPAPGRAIPMHNGSRPQAAANKPMHKPGGNASSVRQTNGSNNQSMHANQSQQHSNATPRQTRSPPTEVPITKLINSPRAKLPILNNPYLVNGTYGEVFVPETSSSNNSASNDGTAVLSGTEEMHEKAESTRNWVNNQNRKREPVPDWSQSVGSAPVNPQRAVCGSVRNRANSQIDLHELDVLRAEQSAKDSKPAVPGQSRPSATSIQPTRSQSMGNLNTDSNNQATIKREGGSHVLSSSEASASKKTEASMATPTRVETSTNVAKLAQLVDSVHLSQAVRVQTGQAPIHQHQASQGQNLNANLSSTSTAEEVPKSCYSYQTAAQAQVIASMAKQSPGQPGLVIGAPNGPVFNTITPMPQSGTHLPQQAASPMEACTPMAPPDLPPNVNCLTYLPKVKSQITVPRQVPPSPLLKFGTIQEYLSGPVAARAQNATASQAARNRTNQTNTSHAANKTACTTSALCPSTGSQVPETSNKWTQPQRRQQTQSTEPVRNQLISNPFEILSKVTGQEPQHLLPATQTQPQQDEPSTSSSTVTGSVTPQVTGSSKPSQKNGQSTSNAVAPSGTNQKDFLKEKRPILASSLRQSEQSTSSDSKPVTSIRASSQFIKTCKVTQSRQVALSGKSKSKSPSRTYLLGQVGPSAVSLPLEPHTSPQPSTSKQVNNNTRELALSASNSSSEDTSDEDSSDSCSSSSSSSSNGDDREDGSDSSSSTSEHESYSSSKPQSMSKAPSRVALPDNAQPSAPSLPIELPTSSALHPASSKLASTSKDTKSSEPSLSAAETSNGHNTNTPEGSDARDSSSSPPQDNSKSTSNKGKKLYHKQTFVDQSELDYQMKLNAAAIAQLNSSRPHSSALEQASLNESSEFALSMPSTSGGHNVYQESEDSDSSTSTPRHGSKRSKKSRKTSRKSQDDKPFYEPKAKKASLSSSPNTDETPLPQDQVPVRMTRSKAAANAPPVVKPPPPNPEEVTPKRKSRYDEVTARGRVIVPQPFTRKIRDIARNLSYHPPGLLLDLPNEHQLESIREFIIHDQQFKRIYRFNMKQLVQLLPHQNMLYKDRCQRLVKLTDRKQNGILRFRWTHQTDAINNPPAHFDVRFHVVQTVESSVLSRVEPEELRALTSYITLICDEDPNEMCSHERQRAERSAQQAAYREGGQQPMAGINEEVDGNVNVDGGDDRNMNEDEDVDASGEDEDDEDGDTPDQMNLPSQDELTLPLQPSSGHILQAPTDQVPSGGINVLSTLHSVSASSIGNPVDHHEDKDKAQSSSRELFQRIREELAEHVNEDESEGSNEEDLDCYENDPTPDPMPNEDDDSDHSGELDGHDLNSPVRVPDESTDEHEYDHEGMEMINSPGTEQIMDNSNDILIDDIQNDEDSEDEDEDGAVPIECSSSSNSSEESDEENDIELPSTCREVQVQVGRSSNEPIECQARLDVNHTIEPRHDERITSNDDAKPATSTVQEEEVQVQVAGTKRPLETEEVSTDESSKRLADDHNLARIQAVVSSRSESPEPPAPIELPQEEDEDVGEPVVVIHEQPQRPPNEANAQVALVNQDTNSLDSDYFSDGESSKLGAVVELFDKELREYGQKLVNLLQQAQEQAQNRIRPNPAEEEEEEEDAAGDLAPIVAPIPIAAESDEEEDAAEPVNPIDLTIRLRDSGGPATVSLPPSCPSNGETSKSNKIWSPAQESEWNRKPSGTIPPHLIAAGPEPQDQSQVQSQTVRAPPQSQSSSRRRSRDQIMTVGRPHIYEEMHVENVQTISYCSMDISMPNELFNASPLVPKAVKNRKRSSHTEYHTSSSRSRPHSQLSTSIVESRDHEAQQYVSPGSGYSVDWLKSYKQIRENPLNQHKSLPLIRYPQSICNPNVAQSNVPFNPNHFNPLMSNNMSAQHFNSQNQQQPPQRMQSHVSNCVQYNLLDATPSYQSRAPSSQPETPSKTPRSYPSPAPRSRKNTVAEPLQEFRRPANTYISNHYQNQSTREYNSQEKHQQRITSQDYHHHISNQSHSRGTQLQLNVPPYMNGHSATNQKHNQMSLKRKQPETYAPSKPKTKKSKNAQTSEPTFEQMLASMHPSVIQLCNAALWQHALEQHQRQLQERQQQEQRRQNTEKTAKIADNVLEQLSKVEIMRLISQVVQIEVYSKVIAKPEHVRIWMTYVYELTLLYNIQLDRMSVEACLEEAKNVRARTIDETILRTLTQVAYTTNPYTLDTEQLGVLITKLTDHPAWICFAYYLRNGRSNQYTQAEIEKLVDDIALPEPNTTLWLDVVDIVNNCFNLHACLTRILPKERWSIHKVKILLGTCQLNNSIGQPSTSSTTSPAASSPAAPFPAVSSPAASSPAASSPAVSSPVASSLANSSPAAETLPPSSSSTSKSSQ